MLLEELQWSKLYTIYRIKDYLSPKVFNSKNMIYPKNSALLHFKPSAVPTILSRNDFGLNNVNKVIVNTILEYKGDNLLGHFTRKTISNTSVIQANSKAITNEKPITYLLHTVSNLVITNKDIFVQDFGSLNSMYKYSANPLVEYYRWHNCLTTVINNITLPSYIDSDRLIFINIDLPSALPSRIDLEKYINKKAPDIQLMKAMINYKYLNLLDVWKLLTPELSINSKQPNRSLLSQIPSNMYKKIYFIFTIDNKVSIVNLYRMLSIVKEYNIESDLDSYPAVTIKKLFYIYINRLLETPVSLPLTDASVKISAISNIDNTNNIKDIDIELDKDKLKHVDINAELDNIEKNIEKKEIEDTEEDIDSVLTTIEISKDKNDIYNQHIETLEDLNKDKLNSKDIILKEANILKEYGVISKREYDNIKTLLETQPNKKSPYPDDNRKLSELLDDTKDDLSIESENSVIKDYPAVMNKDINKNIVNVLRKKYVKEQYKKDMVRMVYNLQKAGVMIYDYTVTENDEGILGSTETHNIVVKTFDSRPTNIKINLPKIEEDGTYKLAGNTYVIRNQKTDLPIRKIDINKVALSSYYGKLFVLRSKNKSNDIGYWIKQQLVSKYGIDSELKALIPISVDNEGEYLPKHYELLARYVQGFIYKGVRFSFLYNKRKTLYNTDLNKLENNKYVLVGVTENSNNPDLYLLGYDNILYKYKNNNYEPIGSIFDFINIDISNGPIEYSTIKIYKLDIPVVMLLSYYIGLQKLLKILNVKYRVEEANKRSLVNKDEYVIKFKDLKLIIKRDYGLGDIIVYGFKEYKENIANIEINNFNKREYYSRIFLECNIPVSYITEIDLLETLYIDPVTKSLLEIMKMPTTFSGLLIKANELLLDDKYSNPNDVQGMVIRSVERITGMVYKELVTSYKDHINRSKFGKSRIVVNPNSVMNLIKADSTTMLLNDLNPIAAIKQIEDVTALGMGGRAKESMSKDTRILNKSEIGIISEASKDSGDVGITASLTASPKIINLRGNVTTFDKDKDGAATIFSTNAMISPLGDTDDPKRLNFSSIQASHVIPTVNMRAPYVRTGNESIIAIKAPDKFAVTAKEDGKVIRVTDNSITVKYKSGIEETYKLYSWTTKEESESCYTHTIVTDLKVNDTFEKDDTITYDKLFFEPDIFNKKRVIYRTTTMLRVMLAEMIETYEDSAAISKDVSSKLATVITKTKSIIVKNTDNIYNVKKVKDVVDTNDVLLSITDSELLPDDKLDEKTLAILQNIKSISPKSKIKGTISKIVVYYNCDIKDLSPTLKKLVKESDSMLLATTGHTGKVNSSYTINGVPLLPNEVEIKFYIDVVDNMGIGDKGFFGNQLKFTVGNVFSETLLTEDGKKIEAIFSNKSIGNRIVNSPYVIGTTSTALEVLTEKVVEEYFK